MNTQSKYAVPDSPPARQTGSASTPEGGAEFNPVVKTCSCGKTYTQAQWQQLRLCCKLDFPNDHTGPEEHFEFRDCHCGSTIGIEVQQ
jgi:hypothetical protein